MIRNALSFRHLYLNRVSNAIGHDKYYRPSVIRFINSGSFDSSKDNGSKKDRPRQPFVNERFEPGDWTFDPDDPLVQPPFKSNAKVISKEDYENRPRTGFTKEFASIADAGVVLSWLTRDKWDEIYDMYVDLMEGMHKETNGVTSHEYAFYVIAQKFNIHRNDVAGIVNLIHREERIREEDPSQIDDELQEFIDKRAMMHIKRAYETYDEEPPAQYAQDPIASSHFTEKSTKVVSADDLTDIGDIMRKADKREREKAQLKLDNKIFVEDVEPSEIYVDINKDCTNLLNARENFKDQDKRLEKYSPLTGGVFDQQVKPKQAFKWAAKIIDTREMRKRKKIRGKYMRKKKINELNDTLVYDCADGSLRAATVREANQTAWKQERQVTEFIAQDAKQAWMDKVRGKKTSWGRAKID